MCCNAVASAVAAHHSLHVELRLDLTLHPIYQNSNHCKDVSHVGHEAGCMSELSEPSPYRNEQTYKQCASVAQCGHAMEFLK